MGTPLNGAPNRILYLKYKTSEQAEACINHIDNLMIDKKHTVACDSIKKVQEVLDTPDQYEPIKEPNMALLQSFNIDKSFRDQIIYREGSLVHVKWYDFMKKEIADVVPDMYL